MNMHVFTTGRGTPYGLAMAPVIKVASRTALAERWSRPDRCRCRAALPPAKRRSNRSASRSFNLILDVASGRKQTWADHWGLHNEFALFNPAPIT